MKPLSDLFRATLVLALLTAAAPAGDSVDSASAADRAVFAAHFKEGTKRNAAALPGKDGWLFLTAEMHFLSLDTFWGPAAAKVSRSPKAELSDPIPAIVDFRQQLKARGIELLLVPVPPKAALHPKSLGAFGGEAALLPLTKFYQELAGQGVEVLDLAPALAAADGEDEKFCKTDTHWSGAGCVAAAKRIAEALKGKVSFPKPATFTSAWTEGEVEGDLAALLPKDVPKPPKEKLRLRQVKTAAGAAVEADPASPLLVMGDSHTLVFHDFAAERSGLLDQLALELGGAPDLIGTRGSGSTAVRISLYRKALKDPEYLAKKKVVVWCFTAREFSESDQGWAKVPVSK
jgi:alginate O-acetyltransferase complex protein AlgJ